MPPPLALPTADVYLTISMHWPWIIFEMKGYFGPFAHLTFHSTASCSPTRCFLPVFTWLKRDVRDTMERVALYSSPLHLISSFIWFHITYRGHFPQWKVFALILKGIGIYHGLSSFGPFFRFRFIYLFLYLLSFSLLISVAMIYYISLSSTQKIPPQNLHAFYICLIAPMQSKMLSFGKTVERPSLHSKIYFHTLA